MTLPPVPKVLSRSPSAAHTEPGIRIKALRAESKSLFIAHPTLLKATAGSEIGRIFVGCYRMPRGLVFCTNGREHVGIFSTIGEILRTENLKSIEAAMFQRV